MPGVAQNDDALIEPATHPHIAISRGDHLVPRLDLT
jgi:hypothetical protein